MPEATQARSTHRQAARKGQGWCMPRSIRRFGEKLMAQQVWCWGRDVEYLDGNLLMQFGFERLRDHTSEGRSTCYRLDQDEFHICLWGFGMFFGRRDLGGLYLGRFDFCPRWAPVESLSSAIHWPDELPVFGRPRGRSQWERANSLWKETQLWIADYETWVRQTAGLAYRRECVEDWLRPFVRANRISSAWRFLSRRGWEGREQPIAEVLNHYTISTRNR